MVEAMNQDIEKDRCPVCDNEKFENSYCENCKYDFSEVFTCPLLDDVNPKICNVTKLKCTVKGIEFERCDKYHKYSD